MRRLQFFNFCILNSATTALSTLCQGKLYPHNYFIYICDEAQKAETVLSAVSYVYIYIYIYLYIYIVGGIILQYIHRSTPTCGALFA